jgi:hypothetical protein
VTSPWSECDRSRTLVAGHLSTADLRAVGQWIALNEAAIIEHWPGGG